MSDHVPQHHSPTQRVKQYRPDPDAFSFDAKTLNNHPNKGASNCFTHAIGGNNPDAVKTNPGDSIAFLKIRQDAALDHKKLYIQKIDGYIKAENKPEEIHRYKGSGYPPKKKGYYVVAQYETLEFTGNYHWMRVNQDGKWSEQKGTGKDIEYALGKDGTPIAQPHIEAEKYQLSNGGANYHFKGYWYVQKGGLDRGLDTHLERAYQEGGKDAVKGLMRSLAQNLNPGHNFDRTVLNDALKHAEILPDELKQPLSVQAFEALKQREREAREK